MPAQTIIKLRRGTAAAWASANPTLSAGEMGIETDTQRSKYGDGTTAWNTLPYTVGNSSGVGTIDWNSVQNKPATFPPSTHTHSLTDVTDVTASAAELNVLDGITASTVELNYVDGVTSAIQTQLNGKAATVHTHTLSQITDYTPPVIPEVTFTNTLMLMGA
jgi:hypothetical protein